MDIKKLLSGLSLSVDGDGNKADVRVAQQFIALRRSNKRPESFSRRCEHFCMHIELLPLCDGS